MPGKYRAEIGRGAGRSPGRREPGSVESGAPPSEQAMRDLRRRHAGAVAVVTTRDERGLRGVTVTAWCVVSLAPPRLLVCLASGSDGLAAVEANGSFAVSVLSDTQEFLAEQFAGRAPLVNRRFDGVPHHLTKGGNPVLDEGLAWFDCAVASVEPGGDHAVVFGEVREAGHGKGGAPLVYYDGDYRSVEFD